MENGMKTIISELETAIKLRNMDSFVVSQHEDLADIRAEVLRSVYPQEITHDE